jgi:hypothetical protein
MCFTACSEDEEFELTEREITLKVGQTYQFKGGGGLEWKSFNPQVASIDKNGIVHHHKFLISISII